MLPLLFNVGHELLELLVLPAVGAVRLGTLPGGQNSAVNFNTE